MGFKLLFSLLFIVFAAFLLFLYWFVPISTNEFNIKSKAQDFNTSGFVENDSQFYENMRFSQATISYRIEGCPLQKKYDMLRAFEIISQKTILNFYETDSNEEIYVSCDSKNKVEGVLFIAGEGGPTNITKSGIFNVIRHGKILLIKESSCQDPNIAIHELLHVLGFDHSQNPRDIMYPVSECDQTINQNTIDFINNIYAIPSYPDLAFEDISAIMHGKYLNLNMSIRNIGINDAPNSTVKVYADEDLIKEFSLENLDIGNGRIIFFTNIWVSKMSVDKLIVLIESNYEELKKENNEVVLEIKK